VLIFVVSAEKVPGFDFVPLTVHRRRVFFGLMNLDIFIEGERLGQTTGAWELRPRPGAAAGGD
jgi:hypothetical protein